ncbi:ABC transporter ATP-binding protein [Desulfobacter latus]|uniref:ATP-binding cassette domain-containing protein n=1 Tax=Desulfobacter latus TaxID=2292 RepID=A0A850SZ59_9BACT|nr:ATP-binding cassette domain-containing protein [Desulfobacter latus]NWH05410.1 ATP-binding cassette domain-containing protein [Desulfobacter latus]
MIEVTELSVNSGGHCLLDRINIEVNHGEVMGLIGPSGAGKSTLLKAIAGLIIPDEGCIRLNRQTVSSSKTMVSPDKRKVAMVFQTLALWPHMTVQKHLEFVMAGHRCRQPNQRDEQINAILEKFHLAGYKNRLPSELSGGEQQRLAIARALAPEPDYLLLDEPSSNLDTVLKEELLELLNDLKTKIEITMIYVTHSIREALLLSDRISVIRQGKITEQFQRTDQWNMESIIKTLREK